jgi:NAD(P)H-flavin reductase
MARTTVRGRLTWQFARVSWVATETDAVRTIGLEVRSPIGRWFVWDTSDGGPLLLVAGGSGIVPLRAILRHRQRSGSDVPVRLLYSARTLADVIYHGELDQYRDGV